MTNVNGTRQQLPIEDFKAEILEAVRNNPAVVITAETGAGKSTQVPQYLLDLLGGDKQIVVTQPRRLAARTVAERVADELNVELGTLVGYRTAQERKDSRETKVLFCTDGLQLIRELTGTGRAQVLVIDEVHEWNLNIETLVAWARERVRASSSFKVVLMSATIEAEKLAAYFDNCPVISVPGRLYPVERRTSSRSLEAETRELVAKNRNVLVFQPGKKEIEATVQSLTGLNAEILPLHGELEPAEQKRCFHRYDRPKVVVATNVAETSVTIPDIDAVVDSGMERRIEVRDGVEGLYLLPISGANCTQRAGRAGRTKEGVYVLCSNDLRPEWPVAEILRSRLDQLVLRLAVAGFDATTLEFFHQPDKRALEAAKRALRGLGALDDKGQVTPIGRRMARFPVDVHYARMILEADRLGVVDDIITIAACLEAGGIRDRSGNWRSFFSINEKESDLIAECDCFDAMRDSRGVDFREAGIFGKILFRAREVRRSLGDAIRATGIGFDSSGDRTAILKAVCAGMVDNLYRRTYGSSYRSGGNGERELARESVLRAVEPEWLVGQPFDLEITNRRGRKQILHLVGMASKVDPAWLLEVAPQLASTTRRNYRFDKSRNGVVSDLVSVFNGQEVKSEVVDADSCPQAVEALASEFAREWFASEEGKAVNAELSELRAKSAGATRESLSHSEVQKTFVERLGDGFTFAAVAEAGIDFSLPRSVFVSDEDAARIRAENPDTVMIGDEVCTVTYKWQPADSWYNRQAKQTVTISVSVATIFVEAQAAVENLIPSGAAYTLQLKDEGYTAILGTDVAKLREEIEKRRLELAWEKFRRENPASSLTMKGLEPLPELPEPKVYDDATSGLAFAALARDSYWDRWQIQWFRTESEAKESQAKAFEAKAKLDAEEDERRNFDQRVRETNTELAAVSQLFAQIDLERYQTYGLSDKEAGKSWYGDSEKLSAKIEQAKSLLAERDRYGYSHRPEPRQAFELLATIRARVEEALAYYQANETKRPEAETAITLIKDEQQAIANFSRENLLSHDDEREVESLATKATEAFEKGDYVKTMSLFEECSLKTAELRKKAEEAKRQKEELKRSANDRLRTLLDTCPVCSQPMVEEKPEYGDEIRLVCRNIKNHPTDRVIWSESKSGLTQYDNAPLANVRPEGTYKSRDVVAYVRIWTDGRVEATWYPTDDSRAFVREDFTDQVILSAEAWAARVQERYEADREYAEAQVRDGYWLKLQFREGRHPKTGAPQWESGTKQCKYVLDQNSEREPVVGKMYYASVRRELVNTGTFRLVVVQLEPPFLEDRIEPIVGPPAPEAEADDSAPTPAIDLAALKARFNRR